ncbi:hypothetical protein M8542_05515 [Amycolatopsis sp. OK19-0408]|uniref:Uncharacterized protein n=1 Tax=Amycolatopsis iheyensis TaxID=2945988 RepID=A0A9X2N6P0_9PSEU|nr:hypothetical protein [Amycolatopsis iheyensis]MCR6482262.1 hypothetical protein [Amycolatopsis iheyensis]
MPKTGFTRWLGGVLLSRQSRDYLAAAAAERRYNNRERDEVEEAQWNVKTVDWPLSHPDDVADDDGFRLLGSDAYVQALGGLGASYRDQPLAEPG